MWATIVIIWCGFYARYLATKGSTRWEAWCIVGGSNKFMWGVPLFLSAVAYALVKRQLLSVVVSWIYLQFLRVGYASGVCAWFGGGIVVVVSVLYLVQCCSGITTARQLLSVATESNVRTPEYTPSASAATVLGG